MKVGILQFFGWRDRTVPLNSVYASALERFQIKTFEAQGLNGLREGERPGRPKTLDARQWVSLGKDLRRSPTGFGYAAGLWDGQLLSEHLRRQYGVTLGVRQCQRLFRQMGFRLRKPRPQVAQSDPAKVAAFKKTAPAGHKKGH